MAANLSPQERTAEITKVLNIPKEVPVSYKKKDLLIYAVGIGCEEERFTYELNPDFEIFPTFPASLFFKGDSNDVHDMNTHAPLKMTNPPFRQGPYGVKSALDGERYVERVRELPLTGGSFVFKTQHVAALRRGNGKQLVTEYKTTMEDADGNVYYRFWSSSIGSGKIIEFDDAGRSEAFKTEVPDRAPDFTERYETSPAMNLMYRLTGDFNSPHVDNGLAKKLGYPRSFHQGLGTYGIGARAVLKACAKNQAKAFHCMHARFAAVVIPGQTLETHIWVPRGDKEVAGQGGPSAPGTRRVLFRTICTETGKAVLSNAFMDIKTEDFQDPGGGAGATSSKL